MIQINFAVLFCFLTFQPVANLNAVELRRQELHAQEPTEKMIEAATSRPWPGKNFPALPSLSSGIQQKVASEIESSVLIHKAYGMLNTRNKRNVEWLEAVDSLVEEKAVWALQSCLCHPSDDVQIKALKGLANLNNIVALPFLLIYAEYMAVFEAGSENATLHGILHENIASTCSAITGISIELEGQDPEALKEGIETWRSWLMNQNRK